MIATSIITDATMGLVDLDDPRREVVLIAPKDGDSEKLDAGDEPLEYVVLFHPAYRYGVATVGFPDLYGIVPNLKRVHAREIENPALMLPPRDDYHDPAERLLRADGGRRIAGFAPVPSPTRPTADPVARECGPENGAPTVREWEILSLTFNQ